MRDRQPARIWREHFAKPLHGFKDVQGKLHLSRENIHSISYEKPAIQKFYDHSLAKAVPFLDMHFIRHSQRSASSLELSHPSIRHDEVIPYISAMLWLNASEPQPTLPVAETVIYSSPVVEQQSLV